MRIVVFYLLLLCASPAYAQGNCADVMIPALAPWTGGAQTSGTAQIFYAAPPSRSEIFGHVSYPITFAYPAGASSVGLMTLTATTFTVPGWEALGWGVSAQPNMTYVLGASGALHPYVEDGIRFIWYHVPDDRILNGVQTDGVTPQGQYYNTLNVGDSRGLNDNLSVQMQEHSSVILGANVIYPDPEPIRVEAQLHSRVCY